MRVVLPEDCAGAALALGVRVATVTPPAREVGAREEGIVDGCGRLNLFLAQHLERELGEGVVCLAFV